MEVRVKNAFKYKGRRVKPGQTIQVDPSIIEELKRKKVIDEDYEPDTGYEMATDDDRQETRIKNVGGGWYELPNGERVRGKENALRALRR